MTLAEYVGQKARRGACICGRCIDAPPNPKKRQPRGHTADMVFFKIAARDSPKKDEFIDLVTTEFSHWLDGEEHSYLEIAADMGDQGIALMTMGLGSLLGAWDLFTPKILTDDADLIQMLAGQGLITIKAN